MRLSVDFFFLNGHGEYALQWWRICEIFSDFQTQSSYIFQSRTQNAYYSLKSLKQQRITSSNWSSKIKIYPTSPIQLPPTKNTECKITASDFESKMNPEVKELHSSSKPKSKRITFFRETASHLKNTECTLQSQVTKSRRTIISDQRSKSRTKENTSRETA